MIAHEQLERVRLEPFDPLLQLAGEAASIVKIPPTGIALEEIERLALVEALKMSNWIQKDAAELLQISPRVMNYKIKTLNIEMPRRRVLASA